MLVTFTCVHCAAKLRINANAMGSDLSCPECDQDIRVPEMSLGPGFVVGGFLIKHKIGQGGMGEVYLARQLSLERDVALKILPSQFTRENSFIVRFLKEVHYQAKMDHPNIVTAFDAGEDNGVYFMAMAYVSGETLEEWLNREGTMDEKDALQVVRQVAMALDYASGQKGILHRDIKPANIMLTPTLHAKVLDMGLSKNTLEKQSTTVADTLLGTPNYMSPEQIDHPQDIDNRADLFSLGMTLYHMLTGQVPYEDTSYLKTLKRHAGEKLPDPRTLMPGISPGVSHLLARMLAREPDDRYPGWTEFLEDLHDVQSGSHLPKEPEGETTLDLKPLTPPDPDPEPTPVQAPGPASSPRKEPVATGSGARRTMGVVFSVLIGLGLGLGGLAILRSQLEGERPSPLPTPTPFIPIPTPVPEPTPTPLVEEAVLARQLTDIILDYEREPDSYDAIIKRLVVLATEAGDSVIADRSAEMIIQVRRERDTALENARRRLREETLRLLYEQGVEAARAHLDGYDSPFFEETETLRSNLLRRVEIRARQEESQREADEAKALELLEDLSRQLAPLVVRKEWAEALSRVQRASGEPAMFPVSSEVAALRTQLLELQSVPELVIDSFERNMNEEVSLRLKEDEVLTGEIVELLPNGIRVMETLYSETRVPQGRVERDVLFSELSYLEVLSRLDPHETDPVYTYRALMLYRFGETESCRQELLKADSSLSDAIWNFLFRPIELPETVAPSPLPFPQLFELETDPGSQGP